MEIRTVSREVVGIVAVPEHEYRRGYETACNYDTLTVPAQVAAITIKRDNRGAEWCSVELDAIQTEHYYMSSLSSSVGSPGGGCWATSVDHKVGMEKPDTVYYTQWDRGMLDFFIKWSLEKRGFKVMLV